jgi:putative membrane protein
VTTNSEDLQMRLSTRLRSACVLGTALTVLGACSKGSEKGGDTAAVAPTTTDTSAGATVPATATAKADSTQSGAGGTSGNLSAANIVSLIGLTNASEIGAAKVAQGKAQSGDVKGFAKLMASDHEAMQKSLDSLATAKHLTPEAPQQADQMRQQDSQTAATLNAAPQGPGFDKTYIDAQVAAHQKALGDLQSMVGGTSDPDLKALLQAAIPKVQQHLDRAQQIQAALGAGKP